MGKSGSHGWIAFLITSKPKKNEKLVTGAVCAFLAARKVRFHSKPPCPALAPLRMKQGKPIVSIPFSVKVDYNNHIGKDRFLFWDSNPHSKLICGSLICTTTCPVTHGKRTHSKMTKDREPCRKFSRKEVPL